MLTPTDVVRAYAAGYIDGEGCVRWGNRTPTLTMESCNPYPMRYIAAHYGQKVVRVTRKTPTTDRYVYRLSYYGKTAIGILREIKEFLIEKKKQAESLIAMWEANQAMSKERRKSH